MRRDGTGVGRWATPNWSGGYAGWAARAPWSSTTRNCWGWLVLPVLRGDYRALTSSEDTSGRPLSCLVDALVALAAGDRARRRPVPWTAAG
ncbi:hypothetical protein [Streptomyces sp. NPDC048581]|uniref:hypothetical protein n=1 Tax=unclassified Streptomyces TaxID=2593676 RepID=UPI003713A081